LTLTLLTVTSAKPEAFSYDQVGNRLTGPGAKDTGYLYNSGNQMTQGRKLTYGYDNNGNQTTKTVPAATDKSWTQTWDFENRLVTMEKVKGTEKKTVTFTYDPQGRRIGKQMTTTVDGVTRTSTYAYVYDNDNIILETLTDDSGTTTTWYTHGAGTDEHLALERGGSFYYYHADGLGSVTTITDQQGSVVQSYEYDSFGMVKASTGFRNSYTYTGREWDKETGLYYYRARYYDPMEGRFLSKDPIGFKGGINLYNYVQNNPINAIDPWGLDTFYINRDLSAFGSSARSRSNPVTHTFVAVTNPDGTIANTYSWGNDANLKGWNLNQPLDMTTAAEALRNNLAERAGGTDLDPYVRDAFNSLNSPVNDHANLIVTNNCKKESHKLIDRAKYFRFMDLLRR